jgi:hypothetical protein
MQQSHSSNVLLVYDIASHLSVWRKLSETNNFGISDVHLWLLYNLRVLNSNILGVLMYTLRILSIQDGCHKNYSNVFGILYRHGYRVIDCDNNVKNILKFIQMEILMTGVNIILL